MWYVGVGVYLDELVGFGYGGGGVVCLVGIYFGGYLVWY